jgi:hypothetical protein
MRSAANGAPAANCRRLPSIKYANRATKCFRERKRLPFGVIEVKDAAAISTCKKPDV